MLDFNFSLYFCSISLLVSCSCSLFNRFTFSAICLSQKIYPLPLLYTCFSWTFTLPLRRSSSSSSLYHLCTIIFPLVKTIDFSGASFQFFSFRNFYWMISFKLRSSFHFSISFFSGFSCSFLFFFLGVWGDFTLVFKKIRVFLCSLVSWWLPLKRGVQRGVWEMCSSSVGKVLAGSCQ